jgi:hypothetical protein
MDAAREAYAGVAAIEAALAEREGRLIDSWQTIRGDAAQLGLIGAGKASGVGGVASVDTPFSAQVGTGTSTAEVAAAAAGAARRQGAGGNNRRGRGVIEDKHSTN